MVRVFFLAALLLPEQVHAAELWCMPNTLCSQKTGICKPTKDEESSVRLNDLAAVHAILRTHAEDVAMVRTETETTVEWAGINQSKAAEVLVWSKADNSFTYTETRLDGYGRKATGQCEVQ